MKILKKNLTGQRVLIRVDFNVPLNARSQVTDDTRIRMALPTIQVLRQAGASIILMSHLGRPQKKLLGDGSLDKERFSLKHLITDLERLLECPVQFIDDCTGTEAVEATKKLNGGDIALLENTRFHKGEGNGDAEFSGELSLLGDYYVNNAFGTAHRKHASTYGIVKHFDSEKRCLGQLFENELIHAAQLMDSKEAPFVAVVGGAKISDKILLLENLLPRVNSILIGGAMAYTFLAAKGGKIGQSLVEVDRFQLALDLLTKAKELGVQIALPTDSVVSENFEGSGSIMTCLSDEIPENMMGLDIGVRAIEDFNRIILSAKRILWNGPMGVFENPKFSQGTKAIATSIAEATKAGCFSLVGGGDSVAALAQTGTTEAISFVSTGGGAMLKLLEGNGLPAAEALKK